MATSTPNFQLDIPQLEKATGLSPNVLQIIKADSWPDRSVYAARLSILAYGFKTKNQTFTVTENLGTDLAKNSVSTTQKTTTTVDKDFYNSFITYLNQTGLMPAIANTPAAKNITDGGTSELESIGALGSQLRYISNNSVNMMTGPSVNNPSLIGDLLNSIHPGMVDELENFCNVIRTHSFLSLPSDAMGSINQAMWFITGAVNAFYSAIVSIYQALQRLMNEYYAAINAVIRMIQTEIISIIEQIIPLDLICMILDAVQTILDDIGFFGQIFGGSDQLFETLNSIQTVVNYASFGVNFAYNPIGGLQALFPQQAQQVFEFVNNIQNMPQVYLSKLMTHIGFGVVANNRGLQIANAIIQHYGLGAQLGPLGAVIASAGVAGNNSKWYRTGNTGTNLPTQVGPYYFPSSAGTGAVNMAGINISTYTASQPKDYL